MIMYYRQTGHKPTELHGHPTNLLHPRHARTILSPPLPAHLRHRPTFSSGPLCFSWLRVTGYFVTCVIASITGCIPVSDLWRRFV
ncbi:hypothetical protein BDW75DRAFT_19201 [Aspergillus navahoensis]